MPVDAYVALGSNLGDRVACLRAARESLGAGCGVSLVAASPLFETVAVAATPQPAYLNAVLRLAWVGPGPRALLQLCLDVEQALGRTRPVGQEKAPRTIDLDLLLHGDDVISEPGLQVPHPSLLQRPFVRIPLAAVSRPGLMHPSSGDPLDRAPADDGVQLFATVW